MEQCKEGEAWSSIELSEKENNENKLGKHADSNFTEQEWCCFPSIYNCVDFLCLRPQSSHIALCKEEEGALVIALVMS